MDFYKFSAYNWGGCVSSHVDLYVWLRRDGIDPQVQASINVYVSYSVNAKDLIESSPIPLVNLIPNNWAVSIPLKHRRYVQNYLNSCVHVVGEVEVRGVD